METTWNKINAQELTIGMFIIVGYWNWDAKLHHSLGKVIKSNKNSFTIQEISISKKDMSQSEIFHRFPIFNSRRRKQITKDGKHISPSREIRGIYRIDPEILKKIGENILSQEKNEIIKIREELKLLKKKEKTTKARIKSLGV